jgi:uncharacterized protein involved in exopolysaccharide biosynthesis
MNIECNTRGVLTVLFRQLFGFIVVFALIIGLGGWFISTLQPSYKAGGSLLVKFGQDAVPDVRLTNQNAGMMSADERKDFINSSVKIMYSANILEPIIKEIGAKKMYPELEEKQVDDQAALEAVMNVLRAKDLKIASESGSIIDVTLESHDPEIAAAFTQRLIDMFVVKHAELYDTKQTTFLQQQVEEARQKLEASRKEYAEYKSKAGISGVDEEMAQLRQEKSSMTSIAYQALTQAETALAELQTQETEISNTYREDSPLMARTRESLAIAERQLAERQADVKASTGRGGGNSALARKVAAIDNRIAYLEAQRGKLNEIEQRLKMDEGNYEYYQQRSEEARANNLLSAQSITRIVVLDTPVVPVAPASPRTNLLIALLLLVGLLVASGLALFRELIDDRFTRPEQIAKNLGIPVLASFRKA